MRIISWISKQTKTDTRYLMESGGLLTFGQIIAALMALLVTAVFARVLPEVVFGNYRFVLSTAAILTIVTLPGLNTAVVQATAAGRGGTLRAALRRKLFAGGVALFGGVSLAGYYAWQGNTVLAMSFVVVSLLMPLVESFSLFNAFLQGVRDFKRSVLYVSGTVICSSVLLIAASLYTTSVPVLVGVYFATYAGAYIALYCRVRRQYRAILGGDVDLSSLLYGSHLSAMSVLVTLANHLDKIIVFHFLGAAQLAVYTIATVIPTHLQGMVRNVGVVALPKFSKRSVAGIKETLFRRLVVLLFALFIVTVTYVLIAPYLYVFLFPNYADTVVLSQLFAIVILGGAATVPVAVLQSQRKTSFLYVLHSLTPVLEIASFVIGVSFGGLLGAVLGRAVGKLFKSIVGLSLVYRLSDA